MFNSHNAFDKIGNNIYLYDNLFLKKELNTIVRCLQENDKILWPKLNSDKDQWKINNNVNNIESYYRIEIFGAVIGDFSNRFETALNLFAPGYFISNSNSLTKWVKGEVWELNSNESNYFEERLDLDKNNPEWGMYFFLGNCKGGEVLFQKEDLEFIPKSGDLLIYSLKLKHEIRPILSGVRYLHINSIFKKAICL